MQVGKVFVSHSSNDKTFVDRLVDDLAKRKIPVWYDRFDVRIGDSIPNRINDGIATARYFLIVLSPAAIVSRWVREELNAALVRQINLGGTFLLPLLYEDCEIPPLLAHRRFADFRADYASGLAELLLLWGNDAAACDSAKRERVFPWPDIDISDREFIYLHSTRFDKFFRMSCSLSWTAGQTIEYLVKALTLPWSKELPEVGMRWSFSYRLIFSDKTLSLSQMLSEAGVSMGAVVQIEINGAYEDLFEEEREDMRSKIYMLTPEVMEQRRKREERIAEGLRLRGTLTSERLRQIVNQCFSHV